MLFFSLLNACRSTSGQTEETQEEVRDEFPMPTDTQAWHTKALIAANPQPEREKIDQCVATLDGMTHDLFNDEDLLRAKDAFINTLMEELQVYHWCFFHMLENLDLTLTREEGTFAVKGEFFFSEMTKLWVLARSLDTKRDTDQYFNFLKNRYLEISQSAFGRDVTTIGDSFDQWPRNKMPVPKE